MKKTLLVFFTAILSLSAWSGDITGKWNGVLDVMGAKLRLTFNISKTESGYTSTMDSPDQKVFGIPVPSTTFENNVLKLSIPQGGINYEGVLENGVITGTFKQQGMSMPLVLSRNEVEITKPNRPQEPTKPYPYHCEEVTFENKIESITLAGTLTLPSKEGKYPVVVLITGSGTQNRDSEMVGHKPFLVIADYLTRNGIGVLRFDDRGTGQSGGDPSNGTSANFATDVEAAVQYLLTRKDIDKKNIGLIGHSEGGLIAPMVAGKSKDVRFIVLLAGPGIRGGEILLIQQELLGRKMGVNEDNLQKSKELNTKIIDMITHSTEDREKLKESLTAMVRAHIENDPSVSASGAQANALITKTVKEYTSPWMIYFIKSDPAKILDKVKCPVLALNGERDLQVTPKENLEAIRKILNDSGNKKVTTKELPGLNHLFQECTTGFIDEYSKIEQTFSPTALDEMLRWIKAQVK